MCIYTHFSDDITSTFQIQFLRLTPPKQQSPIYIKKAGLFPEHLPATV